MILFLFRLRQLPGLFIIVFAMAVLSIACGFGGSPGAAPGTEPATVTLSVDPNPPMAEREVTLQIRVADGSGEGVSGATVSVIGKHINMAMGSVGATATDSGNGEYTAKVKPTMIGKWTFTVTAQNAGKARKADFDLEVK